MMIDTFIFDLDGTLLDDSGNLSRTKENCINIIKSNSKRVVIATGRKLNNTETFFDRIISDMSDYMICCDGQYIYNKHKELIWTSSYLNISDVLYICNTLKNPINIYTNKNDYLIVRKSIKKLTCGLKLLVMRSKKKVLHISEIEKLVSENIEKIEYSGELYNKEIDSKYTVHRTKNNCVEILNHHVSKYQAIKELFFSLGISKKNAVYFGDDDNDRECFQNLQSVSMPTSPIHIKKMATFVLPCEEDAFEMFICRLIGER